MRILTCFIIVFIFSNCNPEVSNRSSPCHAFIPSATWNCEERINYQFCFPDGYHSELYLFIRRSNPYAHLSKGVLIKNEFKDIDPDQFVTIPFPDQIDLLDNNAFTERIEICDDGEIIGIFYYGKVDFADTMPFGGSLYLKSDDFNPKFYLSAIGSADEEGMKDLVKCIIRIKKKA